MTSLPCQTGLQSWQSCTIALPCSVGYNLMSLNNSDCHFANLTHIAIVLHEHKDPKLLQVCAKHNQLQYLFHMLLPFMGQQQICLSICHRYKLVHEYIWHNSVSTNTSYELTPINNVTWCTAIHTFHIIDIYTAMYKFHIIDICPWTNIPTILHICVPLHAHVSPLHFYCSLYTDCTYEWKNCNFSLACHCHIMCQQQIYPKMPYMNTNPCEDMRQLCQYICLIRTQCNKHCHQKCWYIYISHNWYMSLNKYACHCMSTYFYTKMQNCCMYQ